MGNDWTLVARNAMVRRYGRARTSARPEKKNQKEKQRQNKRAEKLKMEEKMGSRAFAGGVAGERLSAKRATRLRVLGFTACAEPSTGRGTQLL